MTENKYSHDVGSELTSAFDCVADAIYKLHNTGEFNDDNLDEAMDLLKRAQRKMEIVLKEANYE